MGARDDNNDGQRQRWPHRRCAVGPCVSTRAERDSVRRIRWAAYRFDATVRMADARGLHRLAQLVETTGSGLSAR